MAFYNGLRRNLKFNSSLFRAASASCGNRSKRLLQVRLLSSLTQQFEDAKSKLGSLSTDPGNEVKVKIYALYKQATSGKCTLKQPGVFDIVGRAKWSAWNLLGDMSQEDAQKEYVSIVQGLAATETPSTTAAATPGDFKTLLVTQEGAIKKIVLNRAEKRNAINFDMYTELHQVLGEAGKDPGTVVTVVTGAGDYYCSGNDLGNFMALSGTGLSVGDMAAKGGEILKQYVADFIDFPKILIALVNGPAVGMSVTVLGLFDLVLASDKATFHTPFSALGQSPEGVSSVLFPELMGPSRANELLLFNRKLSAGEALERNLVSDVYADGCFEKEAWERVRYVASLPPQSMLLSKKLCRDRRRAEFHRANDEECKLLIDRWQSDECMSAIASFMQRKSKL